MDTITIIFMAVAFVATTVVGYYLGKQNGYRNGVKDVVGSVMKFSAMANEKNERTKSEDL